MHENSRMCCGSTKNRAERSQALLQQVAGEAWAILIPLNLPLLDPSEVVSVWPALFSLSQKEGWREGTAAL